MIQKIFAIYDEAARAYLVPFFLPEIGMATRTFGDCINSKTHQFGQHPDHYTLFCLGTFDDSVAKMDLEQAPQSIGNGVEFINLDLAPEQGNGKKPEISHESSVQPDSKG